MVSMRKTAVNEPGFGIVSSSCGLIVLLLPYSSQYDFCESDPELDSRNEGYYF
jgi:hypothetical protein